MLRISFFLSICIPSVSFHTLCRKNFLAKNSVGPWSYSSAASKVDCSCRAHVRHALNDWTMNQKEPPLCHPFPGGSPGHRHKYDACLYREGSVRTHCARPSTKQKMFGSRISQQLRLQDIEHPLHSAVIQFGELGKRLVASHIPGVLASRFNSCQIEAASVHGISIHE
jgi:hypothetical protein